MTNSEDTSSSADPQPPRPASSQKLLSFLEEENRQLRSDLEHKEKKVKSLQEQQSVTRKMNRRELEAKLEETRQLQSELESHRAWVAKLEAEKEALSKSQRMLAIRDEENKQLQDSVDTLRRELKSIGAGHGGQVRPRSESGVRKATSPDFELEKERGRSELLQAQNRELHEKLMRQKENIDKLKHHMDHVLAMQEKLEEELYRERRSTRVLKKETENIRSKMVEAQSVQSRLLPSTPPVIPGWETAFLYEPSEIISGDMFQIVHVDPDHFGFLIGDVSGHGVNAGLLMSLCMKSFQIRSLGNLSPGRVLDRINDDLYGDLGSDDERNFITMFYGLLNIRTGEFKYARGGQNYPIWWCPKDTPGGPALNWLNARGLAIGTCPSPRYGKVLEEFTFTLHPEQTLMLYTDGIVEATNRIGEEYSKERLVEEIMLHKDKAPDVYLRSIMDSVNQFTQGQPVDDDMTLIILRRDKSAVSGALPEEPDADPLPVEE